MVIDRFNYHRPKKGLFLSTFQSAKDIIRSRLHLLGVLTDPIDIDMVPMLFGQRSVSSSPVGSPETISQMLDFAAQHNIKPVIEKFSFEQVNEALARLKSGQARYRIVLCR